MGINKHKNESNEVELVSATEIRRILAGQGKPPLSAAALADFVRDGMPRAARGLYDKRACTYWYIGRLRTSLLEKRSTDGNGNVASLSLEQKRLMKARADNEEMTANERRGVLMPTRMAEEYKAAHRKVVTNKVGTLARRIGNLADLQTYEVKAKMMSAVKSILHELARIGHREFKEVLAQSPYSYGPVDKRGG